MDILRKIIFFFKKIFLWEYDFKILWKKIRTSSFDFSEVNFANGLSAIILLIFLTLLNGKK